MTLHNPWLLFNYWRMKENAHSIYHSLVRDCDRSSLVHDPINRLRYIITPSSVKSLVDDGRSIVVGDTYGNFFTGFAIVSQ